MLKPTFEEMMSFLQEKAINPDLRESLKKATRDSCLIEDVGADSLDWEEIKLCLEDEYDVDISQESLAHCVTLAEIYNLLVAE